jgi:hypothetical protein
MGLTNEHASTADRPSCGVRPFRSRHFGDGKVFDQLRRHPRSSSAFDCRQRVQFHDPQPKRGLLLSEWRCSIAAAVRLGKPSKAKSVELLKARLNTVDAIPPVADRSIGNAAGHHAGFVRKNVGRRCASRGFRICSDHRDGILGTPNCSTRYGRGMKASGDERVVRVK